VLACRDIPIVEFNRAMCVGAVAGTTEAELDEVSAWLETNGAPGWALQVAPAAQTGTVHDWLHHRTMTASGTGWAKFKRGISPAADARGSKVHLRLVNAESAEAFGQVVQAGFALPVATAKWFAALFGRPGWRLYLAYDGETPVASGAAFVQHGIAWFGIDATLTEYRRRGGQTALINRRIEDGRGARLLGFTAETGQPSAGQEAAHTPTATTHVPASRGPMYARTTSSHSHGDLQSTMSGRPHSTDGAWSGRRSPRLGWSCSGWHVACLELAHCLDEALGAEVLVAANQGRLSPPRICDCSALSG
jgi:hypothetical protein